MVESLDGRSLDTITLTPAADLFMRRMVRLSGKGPGAGFRLKVTPGGCSGMNAEFSVEAEPVQGDRTLTSAGLKLFLPTASYALLDGVTVDFKETATETGFAFIDPKAVNCACSTSGAASQA